MTLTAPISTLHNVTFKGLRWGHNEFVARCTCGWSLTGTKAEVYNRAAVHDLEQWDLPSDDDMHKSLPVREAMVDTVVRAMDDAIDDPDSEVYK